MHRGHSLNSEAGYGLVEVAVSAFLVVVVALGVFVGLDGASATSAINKSRAAGITVAQADQDRLRAVKASELTNFRQTRTQTLGGISYTVVSRADWITDSSGTQSCTQTEAAPDYVKITSTVSWPAMHGTQPVTVSSLVAPPPGSFSTTTGSLAVQVRDRTGTGVPGLPVTISGPAGYTESTNALGCVLWGFIPGGNYNVTFGTTGWVDRTGNSAINSPVSVINETVNTAGFDYDRAGTINLTFDTKPAGSATPVAAQANKVSVANSGIPAPNYRLFGTGTAAATIQASSLFPFTDPYALYSGDCANNDPRVYSQAAGLVTVGPGGTYSAVLREPALNVLVKKGTTAYAGATIKVTQTTAGCAGTWTQTSNALGRQPDPSYPYGTYTVCVYDPVIARKIAIAATQTNTNPNGTADITATFPASGTTGTTSGTCP